MYEEYFRRIEEECFIRNRTKNTTETYTNNVSAFLKWCGNKPLEELTLLDARNYILELRKNGKKAVYCNVVNSSLAFFYQRVLHKHWDYDEVPRMKRDWTLPEVLTLEEVELLIDTATEIRNKAIIALLYSSGLRVSELSKLAPEDIYMGSMMVHVRGAKNHGDRWTILSERTLEYLKLYWYSRPEKRDFLFVSLRAPYTSLKASGIEAMIKKIGKEAGFDKNIHPHMLRHSFASHLLENGVSLQEIQAMMGHRSPVATSVYIHVTNKTLMGIRSPLDHPQKKKRGRKRRMSSDVTVQNVFRRFLPEYSKVSNLSDRQYLTANCILNCHTVQMGANVSECEACHSRFIHYNSCKNRHCPMCQGMEVDEWIDIQQENVINTTYFYTVFTIPEQLYSLVYSNQKLLYNVLYHAANATLSELSADRKYLGAKTGYICVLHTWGSRMNYHPHLHTIVLGGGLDAKNRWTDRNGKMFFPVKVMSAVFKKYYLKELKELWENKRLEYYGSATHLQNYYAFKELLNKLYEMNWVVYTKKAFNGAESVINYLGRYTHRIAISNRRVVEIEEDKVTYMVRDYKNGGKMIPNTIAGVEFIRMFLMHVLPKGFMRIRHYGLLSCRNKKDKMVLCRNLLGCEQYISKLRGKTVSEKIFILFNRDICKCANCGQPVRSYAVHGQYMLC